MQMLVTGYSDSRSLVARRLAPFAKILLRQGITAHEFSRWAEVAFVLAAVEVLREQGKQSSFSRISATTGIHRHAVSTILGGADGIQNRGPDEKEYQRHRLARVLTGWFENPAFTDSDGRPRVLPLDGTSPSFAELVRAHSGDIYPGIILDGLVSAGAARVTAEGMVEALSRRYTSGGADEAAIQHASIVAGDVLGTIEHNMRVPALDRLFEDAAISLNIPADAVPRLARLIERRGTAFLDDLDGWLSELEAPDDGAGIKRNMVRAGVRVVMVCEPLDGDDDTSKRET
jgi:hypothetical protein